MSPALTAIVAFTGPYRFLSNFCPSPIPAPLPAPFDGAVAATVEHAFQAAKVDDPDLALRVLNAPTPGEAKRLGRAMPLRPGWDVVRLGVMRSLLHLKFESRTSWAAALLGTGDALLVEGNTWGDRFWGAVEEPGRGLTGHNWLGHLLMARRAELRAGCL